MELAQKVSPIKWSDELAHACNDHVKDLCQRQGNFTHKGSDGSNYGDRVERYCRWGGSIFEAMDFAPRSDALDIVISWLVDDGNAKRTHRMQLRNPKIEYFAVSSGSNKHIELTCTVALFAN